MLLKGYIYKKISERGRQNKTAFIEIENGRSPENSKSFTYGDIKNRVDSLINYFGTNTKKILLLVHGGIIPSILWITALSGGYDLIPLPSDIPMLELKDLINYYKPDYVIESPTIEYKLNEGHYKKLTYNDIYKISEQKVENIKVNGGGYVYLQTSGSTGKPKVCHLPEFNLTNAAINVVELQNTNEKDICFNPLPLYHINAPVIALFSTMISGGTMVHVNKFSLSKFIKTIKLYKITWLNLVPTIINILKESNNPKKLKGVRFARSGTSSLGAPSMASFEEKYGVPIIETYGMTETCTQITANDLRKRKVKSVGIPRGIELVISNKDNKKIKELPFFEIGEICVKGKSVISSYEDNIGSESFTNGYFRTGDLGYKDEEGYVFITGRKKDIIIYKGETIYPKEIEEIIIQHPKVIEVAVTGRPNSMYGETVVAFLVIRKGDNILNEELDTWVSQRLRRLEHPIEYIFLDTLPKLRSGKINKLILKKQLQNAGEQESQHREKI